MTYFKKSTFILADKIVTPVPVEAGQMQALLQQWCEVQVLTVITWTHNTWNLLHAKQNIKHECKIHEGEDFCFIPSCIPSAHSWLSINTSEMNESSNFRVVSSTIFLNI